MAIQRKKLWYLQAHSDGTEFWSDMLHHECYLIESSTENPFKEKEREEHVNHQPMD